MDGAFEKYLARKAEMPSVPKIGTREISAVITGEFVRPVLNAQYVLRFGQVPRFSGWPPFVSLLNADSEHARVHYDEGGVESLEYVNARFHSLDFSRIEASGRFYYLEGLRDDLVAEELPAFERLEYVTETARVTEVIAVILLFAKMFCGSEAANEVTFSFRWRGLAKRWLWFRSGRTLINRRQATQDEIVTHATIPVATPVQAIGLQVENVIKPVFRLFGGWEFESDVILEIVTDRLKRRL